MKTTNNSDKKSLGLILLIAITLGGMIGGGIFSILGVSVEHIGNATPKVILRLFFGGFFILSILNNLNSYLVY